MDKKRLNRIFKSIFILIIFLSLISCAGRMAFKRGEEALRAEDWDQAVQSYLEAVQTDPDNPRYRLSLAKALLEASSFHCERGEKLLDRKDIKLALIEFQKALDYNPENLRAGKRKREILQQIEKERRQDIEKTEIEMVKERARKKPLRKPIINPRSDEPFDLVFKDAELTEIFETLQKSGGINILFDSTFKSKKIFVNFLNVTFKEALERLLIISGLFYKVLDEQTLLIIPDTPAKRREYEELVLKTFYISNADVNQMQSLLRVLADVKVIAVNPTLNTVSIREPQEKIDIAERVIASQDKSSAELLIDAEILEVNKSRMNELGIELSNYQITQSLSPGGESVEAGAAVRGHMFYNLDSSDFLFSIPSISYKLLENDTQSKIIARPQLRVVDGEKISVKLGDKVPVPVTSFVPIAAGGVNQQAITSYQMYDVGINIEITPRIHHNGDITLKLKFELTFITTPGTSTLPPTIGNRSVDTIIRMKDNETGLLAGLLRDSERKAWRGIPGLQNIPILNRLFGRTSDEISQTDIILSLTPRITRMPDITEEDLTSIRVGTMKELRIQEPQPASPFAPRKEETGERKAEAAEEKAESRPEAEDTSPAETVLSFMPPVTEVPLQTEFIKKLVMEDVRNVGSLVLSLKFDPGIIRVKEVREGDFMGRDGVKTSFLKSFNNTSGTIQIGISREGFKEGVTGSGEVVSIVFESMQEGETLIIATKGNVRNPLMTDIPFKFPQVKVIVK